MSWAEISAFERLDKKDHNNDPTLAVDGLSDFFPSETTLDPESALAVGTFGELFPGRELAREDDAVDYLFRRREADAVDYFSIANDAPTAASEALAETPVDGDLSKIEQVFVAEQVFESGHIFQTDSQRAALEFQRFAEKFHVFATECQERVTV